MNRIYKSITIAIALGFLGACGSTSLPVSAESSPKVNIAIQNEAKVVQQDSHLLSVATWNVEHLAYPIDQGCRPRSALELEDMRAYANSLNADVIALQEVASKEAVHLLFPESEWQVIMSARPDSKVYDCRGSALKSTQQKTAIAVKKSLKINAIEQNQTIALGRPGLRFGLGVTIESALGDVDILNLHLKSGCFVDDYLKSDSQACQNISEQADILYDWIEQHESTATPYIILGDFNHRISAPYNRMTQSILAKSKSPSSPIQIVTQPIIGCHPRYPAPIDHIIVGGINPDGLRFNPSVRYFENMQEEAMLSDHCATSLEISQTYYPLSSAVKWQVNSKEYKLITSQIYKDASANLVDRNIAEEAWVVVMDIDETILDNSQYQVNMDTYGRSYSSATWADWVKSQKATLVPGAKQFIETVLSEGGKLVFVTNRDKTLDADTWANLQLVGLPIDEKNTCLIGRTSADKDALKDVKYDNDKDLRREQVRQGEAKCFTKSGTIPSSWKAPHSIIMQVGDNIEDINNVTQEDADIDSILPRWGKDIIILPNPMYGSWH